MSKRQLDLTELDDVLADAMLDLQTWHFDDDYWTEVETNATPAGRMEIETVYVRPMIAELPGDDTWPEPEHGGLEHWISSADRAVTSGCWGDPYCVTIEDFGCDAVPLAGDLGLCREHAREIVGEAPEVTWAWSTYDPPSRGYATRRRMPSAGQLNRAAAARNAALERMLAEPISVTITIT